MTTYRYTRDERDNLGSGRIVVKGDTVRLTTTEEREPMNARLIRFGALVPEPESTTPTPRRPRRPKTTPPKEH